MNGQHCFITVPQRKSLYIVLILQRLRAHSGPYSNTAPPGRRAHGFAFYVPSALRWRFFEKNEHGNTSNPAVTVLGSKNPRTVKEDHRTLK